MGRQGGNGKDIIFATRSQIEFGNEIILGIGNNIMRGRYKIVYENNIYFVTSSIVEMVPVFTNESYFQILIDAFKFCQKEKKLKIHYYVILDNHFHLIVSGNNISRIMLSLKRFSARMIIKKLQSDKKMWLLNLFHYYKKRYKTESTFQIWQEGFHPQLIHSYEMLNQKIEYLHYNLVKRGFVRKPEYWKYSSACNIGPEKDVIIALDKIEI